MPQHAALIIDGVMWRHRSPEHMRVVGVERCEVGERITLAERIGLPSNSYWRVAKNGLEPQMPQGLLVHNVLKPRDGLIDTQSFTTVGLRLTTTK